MKKLLLVIGLALIGLLFTSSAPASADGEAVNELADSINIFLGVVIMLLAMIGFPLLLVAIVSLLVALFVKSAEPYKKWLKIIAVVCAIPIFLAFGVALMYTMLPWFIQTLSGVPVS